MIGYLKGKVIDHSNGVVIIECGGVGYEVTCSASVYANLAQNGYGEAYIYTAVREDEIALFGFINQEEKRLFLQLITVSGIGPKMGISILSCMNAKTLVKCIASGDAKGLSQVKGLGKKTAERIILELQEKMGEVDFETGEVKMATIESLDEADSEAVDALTSLGFTKSESTSAVKEAKRNGCDTVEKVLAYALKHIK
ncbi:MAG: Holliday junction branch migration protein RuvA [Clostridia bacterium]|nr:Holliday junction branch migration protein RuvA [Clostridia bacterium]